MKKSQLFISFVKPDFKVIQSKRVFDKAGTCIFAGAFLFSQYDSVIMTIPGIGYINGGMILGESLKLLIVFSYRYNHRCS